MALKHLLEASMGLDLTSVGQVALDAALRARVRATGASGVDAYTSLVCSDEQELRQFIEEIVVSETWFMRDRVPFAELARLMVARSTGRAVRVLSIPCATGEEAYSIAITLHEAGLPGGFSVDAVDISAGAIAIAQRGVFAEGSFRGNSTALQQTWFTCTSKGWTIHPEVKHNVTFRRGNVLDENVALGRTYDAIFCRNLLIYLAREARIKAISVLTRALAPGGVFFAGHAESMPHIDSRFARIGEVGAFAYAVGTVPVKARGLSQGTEVQRSSHESKVAMPAGSVLAQNSPASRRAVRPASPETLPVALPAPVAQVGAQALLPAVSLDEARRLADGGRFPEAKALCERYVAKQRHDPLGHVLLGLIALAMKDSLEAEICMERALYLDPLDLEAMEYLSSLYARRGNLAASTSMQQRAARARGRKEEP